MPPNGGGHTPSRALPQLVPSALGDIDGVQWPYHFPKADDGPADRMFGLIWVQIV